MSDERPPAQHDASERPALDERLVQWMAVQALQDRYARLAEGGADVGTRIELATLFVDLPVSASRRRARGHAQDDEAMLLLLGVPPPEEADGPTPRLDEGRRRWLLVGGPGSGKSTLTTMVAQALRLPWIDRQAGALPEQVRDPWARAREPLAKLAAQSGWERGVAALPLRVSLPSLARWMASRGEGVTLWDHLAARMVDELGSHGISTEVSARELRAMAEAAGEIVWILDGLDEVPPAAGRGSVIRVVRATVCEGARGGDRVVVSTRPQGYEGEFDDLDAVELRPLPRKLAVTYAERLVRAWSSVGGAELDARLQKMRGEFGKPEVAELIQTPLHTTMAALLAIRGSLSSARSVLFENYFATILKRELGKPLEHGIQDVDEGVIRALHARAGLALQVRSQAQSGARSSLRRRELRAMLTEIYTELGNRGDDVRANVDRIMRFAAERLVLLLHASEGEYEFGVRSLQEFFAAQALEEGTDEDVRARLDAVALDPHWSNVLAFVVSRLALKTSKADQKRALLLTVGLCRDLNAGTIGGEAARRCFMGSRLAIAMLGDTERYGHPWLHDPLWEIALEAATSPAQTTFVDVVREAGVRRRGGAWNDNAEIHTRLGLLAARWMGTDAVGRRQRVIEKVKALLAPGGGDRLNGWRLLRGLLPLDDPEAIGIADTYAPTTSDEAQRVVRVMENDYSTPLPRWLHTFVDRHLAWFTPGSAGFGFNDLSENIAIPFRVQGLLQETLMGIPLLWGDTSDIDVGSLNSIVSDTSTWKHLDQLIPCITATWTAWQRVARFMATPSHSSLADVLEAGANEEAFRDLSSMGFFLPWPIRVCLEDARTPEELLALSSGVRDGELGSIEDWRAAEVRWHQFPRLNLDEVGTWLEAHGPWNSDIALRGRIVSGWYISDLSRSEVMSHEIFSWLLRWIEKHSPPSRKALRLLAEIDQGNLVIPLNITRLADREGVIGGFPDLTGSDAEEWITLLDDRGRVRDHQFTYFRSDDVVRKSRATQIAQMLGDRLREHPEQWGLMGALRGLLGSLPDYNISALALPALPEDAPPQVHMTRAFLALLSGRDTPSERMALLARLCVNDSSLTGDICWQLAYALRRRVQNDANMVLVILAALDAQPPFSHEARDELLGALYAHLRRSLTPAFATEDAWRAHDLPAPYIDKAAPPPPPPRLLRIAELTNIRLFRDTPTVDSPFPLPEGERGQWIVLVGENGVGKTTLLRALALTLAAPSVASKLLDERLPMTRNGGEGRVSIELDAGTYSIAIRRDERTELVEPLSSSDTARPWVVGYGVRRGNARGEKDREAEIGPIGELHTLFDRPASLHNAAQWLKDLDADVLREQRRAPRGPDAPIGPREGVWRSVEHALKVLLGVTKVEVDEGGLVYVSHPQFDRVRLDALSDGYLTTAGWVIDMIARWIDRQQELDEPVGADVLRQMCGFVLLDEIDLHLHPMWQMQILEDVRRLFPRLSFIVTTHNPLTLQGARRGEVYVMRRNGAAIELVQRDIRPGQDVDRVLFEQFGVEHTFDKETRDLLALHRGMLERGVPRDDPERTKIEAQLRERFGDVGDAVGAARAEGLASVAPLRPDERGLLTPFLKKKS